MHQIAALERLPRSCATYLDRRKLLHLRFTGCLLAQLIGKLLDSGAAACLTLGGKSLYSRRSVLIFGSEVLKRHLPTGRRTWRRPGIKAHVREYLLDGGAFEDRRNHRKRSTAVWTMFEVQVKDPLTESDVALVLAPAPQAAA